MRRAIFIVSSVIVSASHVQADPLEDAYRRGFEDGYAARGQLVPGPVPGTTMKRIDLDGLAFKTTIMPKSGTNFDIGSDSTVAIVPKNALGEFKQKLGTDFLANKNIIIDTPSAQ
ncbi:hypothetical protein [Mesorhizobium sp. WSM3224]|uniref:hypothetical protein n=1 Tax=Mesorhizobium sp. WSM3224 TaxID=1040986 RepID=UPI0018DBDE91|nr:hypothetical protein [Mesorhizobium sp. WSM3224]